MSKHKYSFDGDIGISYQDAGLWRNYELISWGDSLQELIENATIAEIDQDGGELGCYKVSDGPYTVEIAALEILYDLAGIKFNSQDPYRPVGKGAERSEK